MNGKRFSESKARKNGFYLALAVCLVAVGIAAWSTYDTVHTYLTSNSGTSSSSQAQEGDKTSGTVSTPGTRDSGKNDDPEAPRTAATPAPARQTVGSVTNRSANNRAETNVVSEPVSGEQEAALPKAELPEEIAEEEPQIPVNAPLYEISEEMIYPLASGEIPNAYSAGAPVYSQTMKDWRIHVGADVKAEAGEQVLSCGNGQVKRTYTDRMLGNVVEIEHGDYEFYYCGLGENFLVKEGDIVTKGQTIGTVTAVPFEAADEPHLHLEVRRDGIAIDPETILKAQ